MKVYGRKWKYITYIRIYRKHPPEGKGRQWGAKGREGRKGKGREGKGRKGREGKGSEGNGRPGKGKEGKGRDGKKGGGAARRLHKRGGGASRRRPFVDSFLDGCVWVGEAADAM